MTSRHLDRETERLDESGPLPVDRPFTTREATDAGVSRRQLDLWVGRGVLRHPLRGVFHASQLEDCLELRIEMLRLVVPDHCVVTDRTAGWLWGADMILAPGDHLVAPKVHVFCPPGLRLRNQLAASGERRFFRDDVAELGGLRVTSPLRTACDLGRLLHRDQALAAMDALAALRLFAVEELQVRSEWFKGYRGVVQFRSLVGHVDARSGSPGESILRLRWIDAGLPRPECQIPVESPLGTTWWLDMGLPDERFAAEYDGEEFHGVDRTEHDEGRRRWLEESRDWRIVVARKANVHGHHQDIDRLLVAAARAHGILA